MHHYQQQNQPPQQPQRKTRRKHAGFQGSSASKVATAGLSITCAFIVFLIMPHTRRDFRSIRHRLLDDEGVVPSILPLFGGHNFDQASTNRDQQENNGAFPPRFDAYDTYSDHNKNSVDDDENERRLFAKKHIPDDETPLAKAIEMLSVSMSTTTKKKESSASGQHGYDGSSIQYKSSADAADSDGYRFQSHDSIQLNGITSTVEFDTMVPPNTVSASANIAQNMLRSSKPKQTSAHTHHHQQQQQQHHHHHQQQQQYIGGEVRAREMPYKLPEAARDWCMPPPPTEELGPLPYNQCRDTSILNSIPLYGGLTNALKMLLLGTILSFENNQCFVVDESQSDLALRNDPNNALPTTFLERYLEPIGIKTDDDITTINNKINNNNNTFTTATAAASVQARDWREVWEFNHNRRIEGQYDDIPWLNYTHIEGHTLKRVMLRRMWRPLPHIRHQTCSHLERMLMAASSKDFMAFSVRQGDKSEAEHFAYAAMSQYIQAAERVVPTHFGGRIPYIFVATDNCSVLKELRQLRPSWTFISVCDVLVHGEEGDDGFSLQSMRDWTLEQTDQHFGKFFVELYAMAMAKYWIGVTYTNVSWWVYFMRQQDKSTFELLTTPGTENREAIDMW